MKYLLDRVKLRNRPRPSAAGFAVSGFIQAKWRRVFPAGARRMARSTLVYFGHIKDTDGNYVDNAHGHDHGEGSGR